MGRQNGSHACFTELVTSFWVLHLVLWTIYILFLPNWRYWGDRWIIEISSGEVLTEHWHSGVFSSALGRSLRSDWLGSRPKSYKLNDFISWALAGWKLFEFHPPSLFNWWIQWARLSKEDRYLQPRALPTCNLFIAFKYTPIHTCKAKPKYFNV